MKWSDSTYITACVAVLGLVSSPARAQCDDFVLEPTFIGAGSNPLSVAPGDWNGDAVLDIAVADPIDQRVYLRFGTGGGTFGPLIAVTAGSAPRGLASGDFDLDGDLDLAVCNEGWIGGGGWQGFGLTVLWNDGAGGFGSATFAPLPSSAIRPSCIAAGDLDLDGDLDVVLALLGTGSMNSKVASFVNDGNGQFAPALLADTGWGPVSVRLGDMDADGFLDAVTVNALHDTITVLHGNGDGSLALAWGHSAGTNPNDVALGDFDGDGGLDAFVSYRYGVLVLRNASGTLEFLSNLTAGLFPIGVALGDLSGDQRLDLAAVDRFGKTAFVWTGDGVGGFIAEPQVPLGSQPVAIVLHDADGDGDLDLYAPVAAPGGLILAHNECPLSTYCVGKANSIGCTPQIGWSGTPSLSGADDFHVMVFNELNNQTGIVFFGRAPASVPVGGGTLCVGPPQVRTPPQNSGGSPGAANCTGAYDFHATHAWFAQHGWRAGDELFAQCWSRDPQHPDGTGIGLSNALRFVLRP